MSVRRFLTLQADIQRELQNIKSLNHELSEILKNLSGSEPSNVELRAIGSILHDFYCAAERIFQRVANEIDEALPKGDDWHIQLLTRMSIALEAIRPKIIDDQLKSEMEDYLKFRHLFRNVYGFELKWNRCQTLALQMNEIVQKLDTQLQRFGEFLTTMNNRCS